MSQKVRIVAVHLEGAPFVGFKKSGEPKWARHPHAVMEWLCDGYRFMFNEYRALTKEREEARQGAKALKDARKNGEPIDEALLARLEAIAGTKVDHSAVCSRLRQEKPFLAGLPRRIARADRDEKKSWEAAWGRIKTNVSNGTKGGDLPNFKKRRNGLYFTLERAGYHYRQVNAKRGEVTIRANIPTQYQCPGRPKSWTLRIIVAINQPIRDEGGIYVNWTKRELVFNNIPTPITRETTGKHVGIDRGVVHTMTTSDGEFIDADRQELEKIEHKIRFHQKAMARAVKTSGHPDMGAYMKAGPSKRFLKHRAAVTRLYERRRNITDTFLHQATTRLVKEHDVIALEDLNLKNMVAAPKPKEDPQRPGTYLHNGRAAKRGLNKAMHQAALGKIEQMIAYKIGDQDIKERLVTVQPAYTSQTCAVCGNIDRKARRTQSEYVCTNPDCPNYGIVVNADVNAALNILERGHQKLRGTTSPGVEGTNLSNDHERGTTGDPVKRELQAKPLAVS